MKFARIASLIILSLIITVACNTQGVKKGSELPAGVEEIREKAQIVPGQFYEECIELYPSQVMHYSFNSNEKLDFNIHYHGMEGRKYAIKKNSITSYKGDLVCDEMDFYDKDQENFCMIWTNHGEVEARLSLKYYITSRPAPAAAK